MSLPIDRMKTDAARVMKQTGNGILPLRCDSADLACHVLSLIEEVEGLESIKATLLEACIEALDAIDGNYAEVGQMLRAAIDRANGWPPR